MGVRWRTERSPKLDMLPFNRKKYKIEVRHTRANLSSAPGSWPVRRHVRADGPCAGPVLHMPKNSGIFDGKMAGRDEKWPSLHDGAEANRHEDVKTEGEKSRRHNEMGGRGATRRIFLDLRNNSA
jgi:hypothetical protein